jgi:hypothetical protein
MSAFGVKRTFIGAAIRGRIERALMMQFQNVAGHNDRYDFSVSPHRLGEVVLYVGAREVMCSASHPDRTHDGMQHGITWGARRGRDLLTL